MDEISRHGFVVPDPMPGLRLCSISLRHVCGDRATDFQMLTSTSSLLCGVACTKFVFIILSFQIQMFTFPF